MKIIKRKKGTENLGFTIDISKTSKTYADISDIIFAVKENLTDDDDTLFLKKMSEGEITTTASASDTTITGLITWGVDEYTNFTTGVDYYAGVFPKFTGDTVAYETGIDLSQITITEDFLKQN